MTQKDLAFNVISSIGKTLILVAFLSMINARLGVKLAVTVHLAIKDMDSRVVLVLFPAMENNVINHQS
jgi:hypothetical protein